MSSVLDIFVIIAIFINSLTLTAVSFNIGNMNEIDIDQLREALSISYPTALNFAREHGRLDPLGSSRGKWVVSVDVVKAELEQRRQDINRRLEMLEQTD